MDDLFVPTRKSRRYSLFEHLLSHPEEITCNRQDLAARFSLSLSNVYEVLRSLTPESCKTAAWLRWAEVRPVKPRPNDEFAGKWLFYAPKEVVNQWWWAVLRAALSGQLGTAIKVATEYNALISPYPYARRVFCCYTQDWRDREDVMRVRAGLRELGITWPIDYKQDIATLARSGRKMLYNVR